MARWKKIAGFGCLGVLAFVLIAGGALWYFKPWIPAVQMAVPGDTGRRITEQGLLANYFPGDGEGRRPAILLLGGSEGGMTEHSATRAQIFQRAGYSVLQLSYYRGDGQTPHLEMIPLEYFDTALDWMQAQPEVDPARIGIYGGSKGAEAALLIAMRNPDIAAVVAGVPSHVVWQGFSWESFSGLDSSWSLDGEPLPYLPYGKFRMGRESIAEAYEEGLENLRAHEDAIIPVETIAAPLLLICGEEDLIWPSCPMARELRRRAEEGDGPPVILLAYDNAGHGVFGNPLAADDPDLPGLEAYGGEATAINAARQHSWPQLLAFFARHLSADEETP